MYFLKIDLGAFFVSWGWRRFIAIICLQYDLGIIWSVFKKKYCGVFKHMQQKITPVKVYLFLYILIISYLIEEKDKSSEGRKMDFGKLQQIHQLARGGSDAAFLAGEIMFQPKLKCSSYFGNLLLCH